MIQPEEPILMGGGGAPSPLYAALHAARYQRQQQIREIEQVTNRRLLVYHTRDEPIVPEDVAPFQELLLDCDVKSGERHVDLLLQSPGGVIDVAEKIVYMLRDRAETVRVIVAERAKSAATMIALAADEILMSATSELGPIDPQMPILNSQGQLLLRPARSILDGLERIKQETAAGGPDGEPAIGLNPAYYPILAQVDLALIDSCHKAIARSQQFAEKWLAQHMLKNDPAKAANIAAALVDVERYSSHGMVIDCREIQAMGINATYYDADDPLWQRFWRLFLAYEVASDTEGYRRMFETRRVSLTFRDGGRAGGY